MVIPKSKALANAAAGPNPPTPTHRGAELAPAWHTAALVGLILAVSITGIILSHVSGAAPANSPPAGASRLVLYAPIVIVQVALALYVARIGRGQWALRSLLGADAKWTSAGRAFGDVLLAIALWAAIEGVALLVARVGGVPRAPAATSLLPATLSERVAWAAVAVSVGISEELVYRGYLQAQLAAFTGSVAFGLGLQAILFALAHADQGAMALEAGLDAIALGLVTRGRRSLLPAILAHVAVDLTSGLVH